MPEYGLDIVARVDARQFFPGCLRRLMTVKELHQAGCDQLILNGLYSRRALRMTRTHVVLEAGGVGEVGGMHIDLMGNRIT